ncbi:MAG: hypothetical protein HOP20_09550 [Sulfuriferula sp.]|nr:hypothetical protein [Sulfuriferula sp.]
MNKHITKLIAISLLACAATPAFADHHDDEDGYRGYRGGYEVRDNWNDRGDRGWERGRGHRRHDDDRAYYYPAPYYQPARVIYTPPPVVYYPPAPIYRSGVEVRLMQLF